MASCLAFPAQYHIAGKFGGEFNLALWQMTRRTAKSKSANISVCACMDMCVLQQTAKLNSLN